MRLTPPSVLQTGTVGKDPNRDLERFVDPLGNATLGRYTIVKEPDFFFSHERILLLRKYGHYRPEAFELSSEG